MAISSYFKHIRIVLLTVFLGLAIGATAHPVYVSVYYMEYNPNSQSVEVSIRVFTDDLEAAISQQQGTVIQLQKELPNNDLLRIEQFVKKAHSFATNNTALVLQFVGMEYDTDVCWIHFEVPVSNITHPIDFSTQWLFDYKTSQSNIVYVETASGRQNYLLHTEKRDVSFELE